MMKSSIEEKWLDIPRSVFRTSAYISSGYRQVSVGGMCYLMQGKVRFIVGSLGRTRLVI